MGHMAIWQASKHGEKTFRHVRRNYEVGVFCDMCFAARCRCYSLSNTCVKWDEANARRCNNTQFVCAGGGDTSGNGAQQIALLAEMELMGDRRHYACPSALGL